LSEKDVFAIEVFASHWEFCMDISDKKEFAISSINRGLAFAAFVYGKPVAWIHMA
jgi:hypothetical protein